MSKTEHSKGKQTKRSVLVHVQSREAVGGRKSHERGEVRVKGVTSALPGYALTFQ